jgi:hypothetical protein
MIIFFSFCIFIIAICNVWCLKIHQHKQYNQKQQQQQQQQQSKLYSIKSNSNNHDDDFTITTIPESTLQPIIPGNVMTLSRFMIEATRANPDHADFESLMLSIQLGKVSLGWRRLGLDVLMLLLLE